MFNTIKFIAEVEKRPSLYDQADQDYANRNMKVTLWNEIAEEMCEDNWDQIATEERDKLGKELQIKWKSIRDHFRKELALENKIKSGHAVKTKKKYIYYDKLHFLKTLPNFTDWPPDSEQNADSDVPANASTSQRQKRRRQIKRKIVTSSEDTEIKQITKILSHSVALQKQEIAEDAMGNKAFLMSLLPFMNNVPENQMIAARCKMMEVIQMFSTTQPIEHCNIQETKYVSYRR